MIIYCYYKKKILIPCATKYLLEKINLLYDTIQEYRTQTNTMINFVIFLRWSIRKMVIFLVVHSLPKRNYKPTKMKRYPE